MLSRFKLMDRREAPTRLKRGRRFHRQSIVDSSRPPRVAALALLLIGCLFLVPSGGSAAEEEDTLPIESDNFGAIVVEIDPRCSEVRLRSPEAKVRWTIDPSRVSRSADLESLLSSDEFRIDLSKFPNGLESGRFDSIVVSRLIAQLDDETEVLIPRFSAVARGLRAGVYYKARVLFKTSEGWVASSSVGFMSSVCPVDGLED